MKAILDRVTRQLERAGIHRFEIYVEDLREAECEVLDGQVNLERRAREESVAIRVLGRGIGEVGLIQPDDEAIALGIQSAWAEAERARPEVLEDFAGPQSEGAPTPFVDARAEARLLGAAPTESERRVWEDRARALEAATLARDPRIVAVRPAIIGELACTWALRTSAGLETGERSTRAYAAVGAVAEDPNDTRMADEDEAAVTLEDLEVESLGRRAADRALRSLGARPVEGGRRPVVLSPRAVAVLLEGLLEAMDGDRLDQGTGFLAGRLGTEIVAPALTVREVPHDPTLDGATWRDGEGLWTRPHTLIEAGRWQVAFRDRAAAARAGQRPLGHGQRSGRGRLGAGPHAIVVSTGGQGFDALLHDADGGLYIDELLGAHTLNSLTGEVSLGATGSQIVGGALGPAFEGVTIAGTLLDLLVGGLGLGAEAVTLGRFRVPALRLPEVRVASSG